MHDGYRRTIYAIHFAALDTSYESIQISILLRAVGVRYRTSAILYCVVCAINRPMIRSSEGDLVLLSTLTLADSNTSKIGVVSSALFIYQIYVIFAQDPVWTPWRFFLSIKAHWLQRMIRNGYSVVL